jgi:hypothetical protein
MGPCSTAAARLPANDGAQARREMVCGHCG